MIAVADRRREDDRESAAQDSNSELLRHEVLTLRAQHKDLVSQLLVADTDYPRLEQRLEQKLHSYSLQNMAQFAATCHEYTDEQAALRNEHHQLQEKQQEIRRKITSLRENTAQMQSELATLRDVQFGMIDARKALRSELLTQQQEVDTLRVDRDDRQLADHLVDVCGYFRNHILPGSMREAGVKAGTTATHMLDELEQWIGQVSAHAQEEEDEQEPEDVTDADSAAASEIPLAEVADPAAALSADSSLSGRKEVVLKALQLLNVEPEFAVKLHIYTRGRYNLVQFLDPKQPLQALHTFRDEVEALTEQHAFFALKPQFTRFIAAIIARATHDADVKRNRTAT